MLSAFPSPCIATSNSPTISSERQRSSDSSTANSGVRQPTSNGIQQPTSKAGTNSAGDKQEWMTSDAVALTGGAVFGARKFLPERGVQWVPRDAGVKPRPVSAMHLRHGRAESLRVLWSIQRQQQAIGRHVEVATIEALLNHLFAATGSVRDRGSGAQAERAALTTSGKASEVQASAKWGEIGPSAAAAALAAQLMPPRPISSAPVLFLSNLRMTVLKAQTVKLMQALGVAVYVFASGQSPRSGGEGKQAAAAQTCGQELGTAERGGGSVSAKQPLGGGGAARTRDLRRRSPSAGL